jgi:hypothetical protein
MLKLADLNLPFSKQLSWYLYRSYYIWEHIAKSQTPKMI